jgi:hypothetical protein
MPSSTCMIGLAPQTLKIYPYVADLNCIQGFHLVGGTALSLQINHRLSEDLDFCQWVSSSNVYNGIDYKEIQTELDQVFAGVSINPLAFNHVDFRVNDVKVTFFHEVGCNTPEYIPVNMGGINCVPIPVIWAMKINTMFERNKFRDYNDAYCLIKDGFISIEEGYELAVNYHPQIKSKEKVRSMLKHWKRFRDEKNFTLMAPKYKISSSEIGSFFSKHLV